MWWKRFLESDDAVSILPEEKLYHLNQASISQLEKMQDQESALQNQINDISFQICNLLATDEQTRLEKEYSSSSAEEARYNELKAQFNNLQYEIEMIEEEILIQETMLYHLTFANQKSAQNLQLKKLVSSLTSHACATDDINERDNCVLCLDLLSGDSKVLKMKINQNNVFFQKKSASLNVQLNELISKTADVVRQIHNIQQQVEDTIRKSDLMGPILPRMKKQLKAELKEFGNTRKRLLEAKKKVDNLTIERDDIQNECASLSAQLLMKPVDGIYSDEEMQEKIELRQKLMNLEIRKNQNRQKKHLFESQLRSAKESIQEVKNEAKEVEKQTKMLSNAIEDQKSKLQKLKEANIPIEDFQAVYNSSKQMGLDDLETTLEKKEEHLKLMKRRKNNVKAKTEKLKEQEKQFDEQIKKLNELLNSTHFSP